MNPTSGENRAEFREEGRAEHMRGGDKVAAILLALDRERAGRLIKHFDQDELRRIARAASGLPALAARDVEAVFEEFNIAWSAGSQLTGGAQEMRRLFSESLSSAAATEALSGLAADSSEPVWSMISRMPAAAVASMLKKERSSIAAYIMAQLEAEFATAVVAEFPLERRAELLGAMISPPEPSGQVREVVEAALRSDLLGSPAASAGSSLVVKVAGIVNSYEAVEIDSILRAIEVHKPKEAAELRRYIFSFDDVGKLSKQALSILLDKLSTDTVVLALRGTEPEFRDTVLSCLASRARRLVESELNSSATASDVDISRARKSIANLVLQLSRKGEIELPTADAEPP